MNSRGFSQVVSTVILIALTIALVGGLFVFIKGFVEGNLNSASACNDVLEKISLNLDYTCFDAATNSTLISISRKDFSLDSLLVSVSFEDSSKTFYLDKTEKVVDGVKNYKSSVLEVSLPESESGKTYCINGTTEAPLKIEIAPKKEGTQCEVVDSFTEIPTCSVSRTCA